MRRQIIYGAVLGFAVGLAIAGVILPERIVNLPWRWRNVAAVFVAGGFAAFGSVAAAAVAYFTRPK